MKSNKKDVLVYRVPKITHTMTNGEMRYTYNILGELTLANKYCSTAFSLNRDGTNALYNFLTRAKGLCK